jgi:L-amino acid N-acyltransferase YncA
MIASIHHGGIAGCEARFETGSRHTADFHERIISERHPLLVAELDGRLVGWAGLVPYSERAVRAGQPGQSIQR